MKSSNSIYLDLNPKYKIFQDVEIYLGGIGRVIFEDDTEQFLDEFGNEFSPRLPEKELAEFCEENINKYETFHDENVSLIIRCETPAINPFW